MPRISDDHFAKIPGAGPKRLDQGAIKPPRGPGVPWRAILGLLVVAVVAGGAWFAYEAGMLPRIGPETLGGGTSEQYKKIVDQMETELTGGPLQDSPILSVAAAPERESEPDQVVAAPVPAQAQATLVSQPAAAAQRRRLVQRVEQIASGIANIERQAAQQRADLRPLQAQVTDSDTRHWPKPNGPYTYENYLVKLRDDARAAKKHHLVHDLEVKWSQYRDNRNKTLREIERIQGLLASSEKRLAAAQAERAAAQAELAALP